jgi:hypothetical protein|tara:strand:+ start:122 stop:349 length:228 start_codon:yes stop_codon:yes gene_type:complete
MNDTEQIVILQDLASTDGPGRTLLAEDVDAIRRVCDVTIPKLAKIAKALDRISKMSGIMVSEHARKIALEALKHE